MNAPVGASISIRLAVGADGNSIKVSTPHGEVEETKGLVTSIKLQELRASLQGTLEEVSDKLSRKGGLTDDIRVSGEALILLRKRGFDMLYDLFRRNTNKMLKAQELCRKAHPQWASPPWEKGATVPPLVSVDTLSDYGVPFELLPVFDIGRPKKPDNLQDLGALAARFLGMNTQLQIGAGGEGPQRRLENGSRLAVRSFINRSLPGLGRNVAYFKRLNAHVDFQDLWPPQAPGVANGEELAGELAERLWDLDRGPSTQVHYFFCHCETSAPSSEDFALRFDTGALAWRERVVRLGDLDRAIAQLRVDAPTDKRLRPLVFLNACASANNLPTGLRSFPATFSDEHFLGFIGTEATMPDTFASFFAQEFFTAILTGVPLGRALHHARWEMLKKHKSPLGLLYRAQANPDIQIRFPVPLEQIRSSTTAV